jgi:Arc/MetJ-type ribon-helix-helix transcriptional regulator
MTIQVTHAPAHVKVSTTLPAADVAFIEDYVSRHNLSSRAAAYHEAVRELRHRDLETAYADADREWYDSPDAALWDATVGDGIES